MLYGLPAASYAVATPLLSGGAALTVVLVSMVTSWTLAQALAYLGYARLSGLDRGGAAQVLRAGLPAARSVLGVALAAAALLAPVGAAVLAFAAAQGVYLLAATVLLVLKAERWVFAALAPGALASVAYLMAGPARVGGRAAVAAARGVGRAGLRGRRRADPHAAGRACGSRRAARSCAARCPRRSSDSPPRACSPFRSRWSGSARGRSSRRPPC